MKKIVSTLIALMMVLVCFAGCSSTPAADSDSSALPPTARLRRKTPPAATPLRLAFWLL